MSLLEKQFQELKLKQRKAARLRTFLGLVQVANIAAPEDAQEDFLADTEVDTDIRNFLQSQIDFIENGKTLPAVAEAGTGLGLTEEELAFVKTLFQRAAQKGVVSSGTYAEEAPENSPMSRPSQKKSNQPPGQKGNKDLLTFAMDHKHLNGRRVIASTKNGKIGGTVTGAEMPHLWIKTDTGHVVPILPENLTLE
jgi:hypothetical protein